MDSFWAYVLVLKFILFILFIVLLFFILFILFYLFFILFLLIFCLVKLVLITTGILLPCALLSSRFTVYCNIFDGNMPPLMNSVAF